jgi:hypothetical protein
MQEQNKPTQDQPLRQDTQQILTTAYKNAAAIHNPCYWGGWTVGATIVGSGGEFVFNPTGEIAMAASDAAYPAAHWGLTQMWKVAALPPTGLISALVWNGKQLVNACNQAQ